MNKISNYEIIKTLSAEEMRDAVNESIDAGWQPLGGCVIIPHIGEDKYTISDYEFHQTMVQYYVE